MELTDENRSLISNSDSTSLLQQEQIRALMEGSADSKNAADALTSHFIIMDANSFEESLNESSIRIEAYDPPSRHQRGRPSFESFNVATSNHHHPRQKWGHQGLLQNDELSAYDESNAERTFTPQPTASHQESEEISSFPQSNKSLSPYWNKFGVHLDHWWDHLLIAARLSLN